MYNLVPHSNYETDFHLEQNFLYIYVFDIHWPLHIATFITEASDVIICPKKIIFMLAQTFRMSLE